MFYYLLRFFGSKTKIIVISLKTKISFYLDKAKQALKFFLFFKSSGKLDQLDINRKLVYSLSPRKIPNSKQLKYLKKYLNPRENLIIKICLLIIVVNTIYLGIIGFKRYIKTAPTSGGTYSEAMVGYPKNINPLYASSRDVDNDLSRLIYSSLFAYNDKSELTQDLVNNYQLSADGKEYLVTIKDGVSWHNGDKLTSDDIIFTVHLIQNEEYRSPLRNELSMITVEKIDNLTIKFVLPEPYAPFLEILTFNILPKNIWEKVNPDSASLTDLNLKPIGSGPYKFKSLIKSKDGDLKEYNLEVNNSYYGALPYIKNLNFKFFSDQIEAIANFNNGQVDGLSILPFNYRSDLLIKDSIKINELSRPQIVSIFFNKEKNANLGEKDVRLALAQAINKNELIQEVFAGAYKQADSPILSNSFAYDNNIAKYDYNVATASSTLNSKIFNITITVIDINGNLSVAEKIKQYWEALGLTVEIKAIPLEQAADIIKNREFEALIYGQVVGGDPDLFTFWHSSQIGVKGLNIAQYSNEEVDKLLLEARGLISLEDRIKKYYLFQEIITNDIPVIFLYSPTYTYVQSKRLKGFSGQSIVEPADRFSNISDWYIKTKKVWLSN